MGAMFNGVDLMPALVSPVGLTGKKVTVVSKDNGVNDFIRSIVDSQSPDSTREPFFVLDLGLVKFFMDQWVRNLPTITPFYAVKCNPNPSLISYMASLGVSFDCASQAEIELVISLGISPDRIIFANPCKPDSHIRYASRVGVARTTFDSVYEVGKIKRCFPDGCQLLIRLKPPIEDSAKCPLGSKYGALPHEVEPLLKAAKDAGIDVVGVSFHVGSGTTDFKAFRAAISTARDIFDMAVKLGLPKMRVLDIGGGFIAGPQFDSASQVINMAILDYFHKEYPDLETIAEPGRYFAELSFTLAANVIGKRLRGDLREYFINDGIYGSINCILTNNNYSAVTLEPLAVKSPPENTTHRSTVFGPTCDALDTVAKDYQLPEMEIGDWLVLPNRGAYSSAGASNFNGFKGIGLSTHLVYSERRQY